MLGRRLRKRLGRMTAKKSKLCFFRYALLLRSKPSTASRVGEVQVKMADFKAAI